MISFAKTNKSISIPWIITVALLSSIYITRMSAYGSLIVFGLAAMMFIADSIKTKRIRLTISYFNFYLFLFASYCILCCIWAENKEDSFTKGITLFEILICMSVFNTYYSKNKRGVDELLKVVMWSGYVVTLYTFATYGVQSIQTLLGSGGRLVSTFNNINEIAGLCAISSIITVFYWLERGLSLEQILLIPSLLLLIACGSKRAIIILVIGIILLLFFKSISNNDVKSRRKTFAIGLLLLIGAIFIAGTSIVSGVSERMGYLIASVTGSGSIDHSTLFRIQLIELGFELFEQHPITGVGIGCTHVLVNQKFGVDVYLHNNYVELLAGGGLIAFIIFYSIHYIILRTIFLYRGMKDEHNRIVLIIMISLFITDLASGTYYSKETFFMLMICYIHAESLKKKFY